MKRKQNSDKFDEKLSREEEEMLKRAFGLNQSLLLDLTDGEKIKIFYLLKWLSTNIYINN